MMLANRVVVISNFLWGEIVRWGFPDQDRKGEFTTDQTITANERRVRIYVDGDVLVYQLGDAQPKEPLDDG